MARCPTCHRRLKTGQSCLTHGGPVAEAAPIEASPFAWPTNVGACLGAGGFASVWALGEDRVIKIAHASHELSRARIAREAEALRAIGEPAVPRCHDSGVLADGRAWIVMERIAGQTLGEVVADGALRPGEAVTLGVSILDALSRVHAARFVHRDLKPDNLVRTERGVVILDLGLARKLPDDPDDPTRANVQVGSLEYIAPEQIEDSANVDERSDIYSFGCVLYELLAGRPPFVGDAAALERAHTALRPPKLGAIVTIRAAVETLVLDCLAKEPARRPQIADVRARLGVARDERTPQRAHANAGPHSRSVIREGKQPVVLLWAELPRVDRALLGVLTGRRLVIVSQRGRKVLAVVLGGDHADPAAVAIAAARDLAAAGANVALHLEALRVTASGGTTTLAGLAIEKPETWLPRTGWSGVVLTSALASVIQAPTREVSPGFRALGEAQEQVELVGREALLTDLVADAATALQGLPRETGPVDRRSRRGSSLTATLRANGPAFALLVGDPGVGKTAFAAALARRLGELGVRVHLGSVPAPGTGRPAHAALGELVGTPTGPALRAIGDALRAAARVKPLAVILDDLHFADHDLLDALEYATLGGEPMPLWVLGVTAPRLELRRPQLGSRAERRRRDVLASLDEDAAVALTATLLQPAEYPPLRALRRIASIAHGNPLHLVMLAREIHQRGAIRERPGGGAHYLDTTALDELSPAALGPWLAARELGELSVELAALARLCAVLGDAIDREELVAIVDAVERSGGATTTVDVDIGLRELVGAGILTQTEHGYAFRQPLVQEGIYATTHEDERLALHRAALAHWRARADDPQLAERVARHAEEVGDTAIAARAFATLGTHALADHRTLDADQAWSGALRNLGEPTADRVRALLGRARARSRLQRMFDALADLEQAVEVAVAIGDRALELAALIEQATVLDHCESFERSAEVAAHARTRITPDMPAGFAIDLELADARALFRRGQFAEAAARLRATLAAARTAHREETATIAALLLGCALSDLRQLDEAETVFGELIERCIAGGDRYHLGAAYGNRAWYWSARGLVDRTAQDLQLVIQLARELGQAQLERAATHNLGEHRLWEGALDDALQLARRGFALQARNGEGTTHPDRLLLARVFAARDDHHELVEVLSTFDGETLSEEDQITCDFLRAIARNNGIADVLGKTGQLFLQLRLELGALAARHRALPEHLRVELAELARTDPLWSARADELR